MFFHSETHKMLWQFQTTNHWSSEKSFKLTVLVASSCKILSYNWIASSYLFKEIMHIYFCYDRTPKFVNVFAIVNNLPTFFISNIFKQTLLIQNSEVSAK